MVVSSFIFVGHYCVQAAVKALESKVLVYSRLFIFFMVLILKSLLIMFINYVSVYLCL